MKSLITFAVCALFASSITLAQSNNAPKGGTDNEVTSVFWTGNFAGGQIIVPVDKIAAVAQQKYLLDGNFMVYEVTIDVVGNSITRIYYIEPVAASASGASALSEALLNRGKELSAEFRDRTGTQAVDPMTVVTKNYPTTTHAHTIEFRVATIEELNAVYKSVSTAFQRSKGRTYNANK